MNTLLMANRRVLKLVRLHQVRRTEETGKRMVTITFLNNTHLTILTHLNLITINLTIPTNLSKLTSIRLDRRTRCGKRRRRRRRIRSLQLFNKRLHSLRLTSNLHRESNSNNVSSECQQIELPHQLLLTANRRIPIPLMLLSRHKIPIRTKDKRTIPTLPLVPLPHLDKVPTRMTMPKLPTSDWNVDRLPSFLSVSVVECS